MKRICRIAKLVSFGWLKRGKKCDQLKIKLSNRKSAVWVTNKIEGACKWFRVARNDFEKGGNFSKHNDYKARHSDYWKERTLLLEIGNENDKTIQQ